MLVAHSLGVHAVAHAAGRFKPGKVRGGFLVAPPAEAALRTIDVIDPAFLPLPRAPLPFPSLVIASRNDLYGAYPDAEDLAYAWGAVVVDAGESGHINADSGHGPWPEGLMRFGGMLGKL